MDSKELKETADVIIEKVDKVFRNTKLVISTSIPVCIDYKYAERLAKNEVLKEVEALITRLYKERGNAGIKRVILLQQKGDKALIEVVLIK